MMRGRGIQGSNALSGGAQGGGFPRQVLIQEKKQSPAEWLRKHFHSGSESESELQKPASEQLSDFLNSARLRQDSRKLTIFLGMLGAAVAGRVALQYVPSVEPIIPFAVLAGMLFGMKEGFTLGGSAYIISNFFVWGLQGPWTLFQALGAALAGAMGGAAGKFAPRSGKALIFASIAGTVLFEILMNISGPLMGIGLFIGALSIPLYFLTSLPFSLIHIISNTGFAILLKPLLKLGGEKDELKIASITRIGAGTRTTVRMYKSGRK